MAAPDWSRLGLTGNPFVNIEPGTHLDWVEWPAPVLEAIARPAFRIELVGEKGAGKSTLLRALAARLEGQGRAVRYCYVPPEGTLSIPPLRQAEVLIVDEADRAARAGMRALERVAQEPGRAIALGVHRSLTARLPGLASLRLEPLGNLDWVRRRIDAHRAAGATAFDFATLAEEIAPRVGRVNYAVLRTLYEIAEDLARGETLDDALLERAISRALPRSR